MPGQRPSFTSESLGQINPEREHHTDAVCRRDKLRYPAGADSVMLAELRQSLPEQEFIARMRTMLGGVPAK